MQQAAGSWDKRGGGLGFRAGDFDGGVEAGVTAILGTIRGEVPPPDASPPQAGAGPRGVSVRCSTCSCFMLLVHPSSSPSWPAGPVVVVVAGGGVPGRGWHVDHGPIVIQFPHDRGNPGHRGQEGWGGGFGGGMGGGGPRGRWLRWRTPRRRGRLWRGRRIRVLVERKGQGRTYCLGCGPAVLGSRRGDLRTPAQLDHLEVVGGQAAERGVEIVVVPAAVHRPLYV